MNASLSHPNQRRLEYWLDHKPAKFERYLAAHPEIAERFEQQNPLASLGDTAREALAAALAAPVDLAVRLRERLLDEHRETSAGAVALDLLGVGTAAIRLIAGPLVDEDPAPGEPRPFGRDRR